MLLCTFLKFLKCGKNLCKLSVCIATFKNYFWYKKVLCGCFGVCRKMCEVCGYVYKVVFKIKTAQVKQFIRFEKVHSFCLLHTTCSDSAAAKWISLSEFMLSPSWFTLTKRRVLQAYMIAIQRKAYALSKSKKENVMKNTSKSVSLELFRSCQMFWVMHNTWQNYRAQNVIIILFFVWRVSIENTKEFQTSHFSNKISIVCQFFTGTSLFKKNSLLHIFLRNLERRIK